MIEAEVHLSLRKLIREQGEPTWQHNLTMARLVARALRLGRSALIQTGTIPAQYRLSYLAPALMWEGAAILVIPESSQDELLRVEIPRLQEKLGTNKEVMGGTHYPQRDFSGLLITSPQTWLRDRLQNQQHFPFSIPTLIDEAQDLEELTRQQLTTSLNLRDFEILTQIFPAAANAIRQVQQKLTEAIFAHPSNPYQCYLLHESEQKILYDLLAALEGDFPQPFPFHMNQFWQGFPKNIPPSTSGQNEGQLIWATRDLALLNFTIYCAPVEVASVLNSIWDQQPVVLMGGVLDWEAQASTYRQQLGLGDLTCLKFSPDRQGEYIQLYLPDRLPMPNTPEFQSALIEQVHLMIGLSSHISQPIVILVEDVPLKAQVGTRMAAEFGSRVKVESTRIPKNGILVSGWEFWRTAAQELPTPQLLVIATLPIPSLENPLVAGRVAYYKRCRKDWFRLYLLPTALREMQHAIAPIRHSQGIVALLDNRVNHRSYGKKILTALEPFIRTNYLDSTWFNF